MSIEHCICTIGVKFGQSRRTIQRPRSSNSRFGLSGSRCWKRMPSQGVATLQEYYRCLAVKPTQQAELLALVNEITAGETCFFRNGFSAAC
jgi:chemotaxis methyl-accepting protein methylase